MSSSARLGIVTVSYNTCAILRQCLVSVQASLAPSGLVADVVVVDNASADGSADMVRQEFPWVHLLANERNAGFAAASNQGLRALGFPGEDGPEYGLLLNPDTVVHGQALAEMVAFMERAPHAGACGARLVYEDGAFQHSAFRFPTLAMAFLDFSMPNHRLLDTRLNGRYPRRLYANGRPFAVDHVLGASLLARRQAAAQVGLLDALFFMYCVEIDWCRRIRKAGWDVYCVPQAEIAHLEARSTRQFRDEMFVALWRSRYQYFRKHEGRLYRTLVRWIVEAGLEHEKAKALRLRDKGQLDKEAFGRRRQAYERVRNLGKAAQ
jgi:N-acetylglucosaminyl-diphospho-decaprenol L-rhamnosyltransferase